MAENSQHILIASLVAPYGVKGWFHVHSYCHPLEAIFQYTPWILCDSTGKERSVIQDKIQGRLHRVDGRDSVVVSLPGVSHREAAEALCPAKVFVPRASLAPLSAQEYYWSDLEGLRVMARPQSAAFLAAGAEERRLGTVDYLYEAGPYDVMVLKESAYHLPFKLGDTVLAVDLLGGEIIVDLAFIQAIDAVLDQDDDRV